MIAIFYKKKGEDTTQKKLTTYFICNSYNVEELSFRVNNQKEEALHI